MNKKSKKNISLLLFLLFMLCLGYGGIKLGQYLRSAGNTPQLSQGNQYLIIAGLPFIIFVVLAVHELGHLITGLYQGFRFELFIVGPLGIKRENDKLKIYFNKNLGYYGGATASSPVDEHPDNAQKFANMLLAGPVASLLFALVCALLGALLKGMGSIIFYAGCAFSTAIFLATTLPGKTGMFFTDRKRYQRLTIPGKDQEVELAMLRILGKFSREQSYRNINAEDIKVLIDDRYDFIRLFGLFTCICYQLENAGTIHPEIAEAYRTTSEEFPKNVIDLFNIEIEKLKEKNIR